MKSKQKFKETEIGKIPEDWEVKSIGDVCDLVREQLIPDKNDVRPYIGLQHIGQGTLRLVDIGKSSNVSSNKFVFHKGQILFGKLRPYFKKVIRPNFDGVCSTDIWVINSKRGYDNGFLFYFFANQDIINEADISSEGTKMPRAVWNYLSKVKKAFPKLPEQQYIAKILSDLDEKIELNQQMNKTLESIAQAIFKHWFIDFEFPNEEGKPYKSSGGEMVDSELGKIPKEWEVKRLGDFIFLQRGLSYKGKGLCDDGIPMINLGTMAPNAGFLYNGLKYYSGEFKEKNLVKPGDIVIANTDITQKRDVLGSPAVVPPDLGSNKILFTHHIYAVRNESKLPNLFIYYLLQVKGYKNRVRGFATGTTVLDLPEDTVLDFKFLVPDKNSLTEFVELINNVRNKIGNNNMQNKGLSQIRDSLLPKLMSGRIRVPIEVKK